MIAPLFLFAALAAVGVLVTLIAVGLKEVERGDMAPASFRVTAGRCVMLACSACVACVKVALSIAAFVLVLGAFFAFLRWVFFLF